MLKKSSNQLHSNRIGLTPNHLIPNQWTRFCLTRFLALLSLAVLSCFTAMGQSFGIYAKDFAVATGSVQTILAPTVSAAWSNYISKPEGFGSGAEGYGYHYGVSLADNVDGKFMRKFVFAAASHQREQYHPLGSSVTKRKRVTNAIMHSLFVSPENSSKTFNWSALPASLAAASLSNVYQPVQQRSLSATFVRFGTTTGSYIFGDVWLEFTGMAHQSRLFHTFLKSR
jgi:hypothetical protein